MCSLNTTVHTFRWLLQAMQSGLLLLMALSEAKGEDTPSAAELPAAVLTGSS